MYYALIRPCMTQLFMLASIGALTPVCTAECECSFLLNELHQRRNHVKTSTLECLMRISIEGPLIADFTFECAADIRGRRCNRRLSVGIRAHLLLTLHNSQLNQSNLLLNSAHLAFI